MADSNPSKRKLPASASKDQSKRIKTKKQWRTPKTNKNAFTSYANIEPGDAGIWVTCDMNKEARCVGELRDLFQEYAEKLYKMDASEISEEEDKTGPDIEADIQNELRDMQRPNRPQLFTHVRSDIQCVLFFRTILPVDPVSFVRSICKDALESRAKRTRYVRRLTPMTLMGKATENGLDEVAQAVLAPHFHTEDGVVKKFAIRPSIRNHGKGLTRDGIIQRVAATVGPGHKVDLKNYDLLILVEVCKNICGMSVVGSDFDNLKRFNLAEIYEPSPKGVESDSVAS